MNIKLNWVGDAQFIGESSTGHKVLMDGPQQGGGQNLGPRPMELLLLGTGGCTGYDVVSILKKSRQEVTACEIVIQSERAETEPKVFTKIHIHFKITGRNLKDKQVARAVALSAEKYCSASIMLSKTAMITHDYEIIVTENS